MRFGAPRIEALLVSLILLAATGVALAAVYVPSAMPRQGQAIVQESSHQPLPPKAEETRYQPSATAWRDTGESVPGWIIALSSIAAILLIFHAGRRLGLPARARAVFTYSLMNVPSVTVKRMQVGYQRASLCVADFQKKTHDILQARCAKAWARSAWSSLMRSVREAPRTISQRQVSGDGRCLEHTAHPAVTAPCTATDMPQIAAPGDTAATSAALAMHAYETYGKLRSSVLLVEACASVRDAWARLTIDPHPDETTALATLPERLLETWPGSHIAWRSNAHGPPELQIAMRHHVLTPDHAAFLLPVAQRTPTRGVPVIRHSDTSILYLPLRTWRHAGLYGDLAMDTLHAALTGLLYAEAPETLALTIVDQGQISPLYENVPHLVRIPCAAPDALAAIGRTLRLACARRADVRPALIVLVEPDADTLAALTGLLTRLRRQPDAPLHLLLVQSRLAEGARQRHAILPAIITPGGQGRASWLSRQRAQPARGVTHIVAPGLRVAGQSYTCDAARLAALLAPLHAAKRESLPPTLWDLT